MPNEVQTGQLRATGQALERVAVELEIVFDELDYAHAAAAEIVELRIRARTRLQHRARIARALQDSAALFEKTDAVRARLSIVGGPPNEFSAPVSDGPTALRYPQ
jgi:prophage DNA circulation protein